MISKDNDGNIGNKIVTRSATCDTSDTQFVISRVDKTSNLVTIRTKAFEQEPYIRGLQKKCNGKYPQCIRDLVMRTEDLVSYYRTKDPEQYQFELFVDENDFILQRQSNQLLTEHKINGQFSLKGADEELKFLRFALVPNCKIR